MDTWPSGTSHEDFTLSVDDEGRVTLPERVREKLGIEADGEVLATLAGSVLEVNPKPSSKLETATAGRDDWEGTTPTDAGETLFGSVRPDTHRSDSNGLVGSLTWR